jgi:hypothetical protein
MPSTDITLYYAIMHYAVASRGLHSESQSALTQAERKQPGPPFRTEMTGSPPTDLISHSHYGSVLGQLVSLRQKSHTLGSGIPDNVRWVRGKTDSGLLSFSFDADSS